MRAANSRMKLATVAAAVLAVLVVAIAAVAVLVVSADDGPAAPRAVLVDQLAATDPNPGFVMRATSMLERAGYAVDYVRPEDVTVAGYADVVDAGYDLLIIRSHSAPLRSATEIVQRGGAVLQNTYTYGDVSLFTTEPFSRDLHPNALSAGLLSRTGYDDRPGTEAFFGITSRFFDAVDVSVDGATVVLMGCGGMSSRGLARSLMEQGAGAVVGWDGLVTAEYTDRATEELLRLLLLERRPLQAASELTMASAGHDPAYPGTRLRYLSDEQAAPD